MAHESFGKKEKMIKDFQSEKISINRSQRKIILLGDSYTKGLGVDESERIFSNINITGYKTYDLSISGNNWENYYNQIDSISKYFSHNDILVIGVNWNDVNFKLGRFNKESQSNNHKDSISLGQNKMYDKKDRNIETRGVKKYFKGIYKSHLLKVISPQIQNTLKRNGLALPMGDFHYFRTLAYSQKKEDLEIIRKQIEHIVNAKKIFVILYLMPDFNLLNNQKYFSEFIEYFNTWQSDRVIIINGFKDFEEDSGDTYCISIHDGHPNGKASKKIGERINFKIEQVLSKTRRTN
jgi:hypothetical protein